MFEGFWQLVVEQNVGLIGKLVGVFKTEKNKIFLFLLLVMITKLEEKGRWKADKYWPSKKKKPFIFDNGLTVKIKSKETFKSKETCQEDLIKRGFQVSHKGMPGTHFKCETRMLVRFSEDCLPAPL